MDPHELLDEFLTFHVGRRSDLFGEFYEDVFDPLVQGVADELSIYHDMKPFARLQVGPTTIREGAERSYLFTRITDRGGPLNVLGTMEHWDFDVPSYVYEFVNTINGRRWRFIEKYLRPIMLPLLNGVADGLQMYYRHRPFASPKAGIIRWLESCNYTLLAIEIDDRSQPTKTGEQRGRYLVQ